MTYLLTVIIPVYNGMPFLQEAVDSILSQSYTDFKILIINDGSNDNSFQYLTSLSDPRIEVIQQDNLGLCRSLNKAVFELTESEFIARLDQDDISLHSRLEEQVNFMKQNPDYACVLSNISRIGVDGREFGYYQTPAKEIIEDYDLQRYGCIVHSTILFRREKFIEVGGYRQELYPVDDFDLLLRFWETSPVAVIKKPLVKYRIHGKASTFSSFWTMETNTRYVLEMHHRRKRDKQKSRSVSG
jgi:glycosyltransferase involved in cell wall biosynthesis